MSFAFGVLSLVVFFAAFSSWSFKYLFNHHMIRNYAHRTHYAQAQINTIVERRLNATHGCRLLRLEIDEEPEEEHAGQFSGQNLHFPSTSGGLYFDTHVDGHISGKTGQIPVVGAGASSGEYGATERTALHYVVGVLFSIVVTLSCELVLLLMIQLFGSVHLNVAIFRFVITALVVLVTLVQPPLIILLYVNQHLAPGFSYRSPKSVLRTAATVGLCGVWFLVLGRFGAIAQSLGGPTAKRLFLEEKTNEVVLAGISITALLSGVGCMLTPIRSFWIDGMALIKNKSQGQENGGRIKGASEETHLNELIQSHNSTKMLREKRQAELDALLVANGGTVYNQPDPDSLRLLKGSGRHFLHRVQSFTTLSGLTGATSEEDELRREIASLRELQDLIYTDVSRKIDAFLREKEHSPHGSSASARFARLVAIGNLLFSVYCVYRIVNVLFVRLPYHFFWSLPDLHRESNIIVDNDTSETLNKNTKDALAITIAKIIQGLFGYLPISETQLINQVSFILSGSLFICSFQNVLVTFKSLGRFFPASSSSSSSSAATTVNLNMKTWIKHLIVSEFLAIYVIATALLIRSNLPPEIAALVLKILSLSPTSAPTSSAQMLSEVEFIDTWFDKVFGASCVVTFLIIAMKLFIEHDSIYDGGYDEEMIIEDNSTLKRS